MSRWRWLRAAGPGIAPGLLLAVLAGGVVLHPGEGEPLRLANPDTSRSEQARGVLSTAVSEGGLVLVGMDPDLGTYPEIRPATRAAIDALIARGARLAFVSFSPEGRAIAAAEIARLRDSGAPLEALADLGFSAGSEAAMVRSVTVIVPADAGGSVADAIRAAGDGIAAFDLALVVSGTEIGAQSWVQQIGTRLPQLPIVAIAPTFAEPELQPYLRTAQLAALLATVRDDAAFVDAVAAGTSEPEAADRPPPAAPVLAGMLIALAFLLLAIVRPSLIVRVPGLGR